MDRLTQVMASLVLMAGFYLVFFLGKVVNDAIHREYRLNEELVVKDNAALALAIVGYYFGLVMAIGGGLAGRSSGLVNDLVDLFKYGLLAVLLLNISWYICDKCILYKFRVSDELIRDQNLGTGAVSAGVSIGTGFILFGSIHGQGGGLITAIVFWAIGQVILIIAGQIYGLVAGFDVRREIERDNVAAGVAFGGALAAIGIIVGLGGEADFISWSQSLPKYLLYAFLGLILLPVIRWLTNKLLLPTVKLTDEIAHQEKPNLGAAFIEAFSYLAAATVITWCV